MHRAPHCGSVFECGGVYNPISEEFLVALPLLTQCDGCADDYTWGLMAGLQGLPARGACYCLGAGWSYWRSLDFPGTHLPLSMIQF